MSGRKIALVGIGKIARDQHIPSLAASQDWELSATVSRAASVDGVEAFSDIDSMLKARPDIEVVSICVPPGPRFAYAQAALQAGRHVMLEKPPGATLSECTALEDSANKAGLTLFATWHSREAANVQAAQDWLANAIVQSIDMQWKEDVRYWHPGQNWVFEPGGMGVFDPGINGLSILSKILPQPLHVTHAVLEFPSNCHTPIAAQLEFFYPDAEKCVATLDWLHAGEPDWSIRVATDAGVLTLIEGGGRLLIDGREVEAQNTNPKLQGEYPRLYARMTELVTNNQSDIDLRPMMLVADSFTIAERHIRPEFSW